MELNPEQTLKHSDLSDIEIKEPDLLDWVEITEKPGELRLNFSEFVTEGVIDEIARILSEHEGVTEVSKTGKVVEVFYDADKAEDSGKLVREIRSAVRAPVQESYARTVASMRYKEMKDDLGRLDARPNRAFRSWAVEGGRRFGMRGLSVAEIKPVLNKLFGEGTWELIDDKDDGELVFSVKSPLITEDSFDNLHRELGEVALEKYNFIHPEKANLEEASAGRLSLVDPEIPAGRLSEPMAADAGDLSAASNDEGQNGLNSGTEQNAALE